MHTTHNHVIANHSIYQTEVIYRLLMGYLRDIETNTKSMNLKC